MLERDEKLGTAPFLTRQRVNRLFMCACYLRFLSEGLSDMARKKLKSANFCRDRFCPHCQKRRSELLYGQNIRLLKHWVDSSLEANKKPSFVLLTLTVPNCTGEQLDATITQMLFGYKNLLKYKELQFCRGTLRTLETTYNEEKNEYHPHIHVMIGVYESYFTSRDYLPQERWLELWKRAVRRDDIEILDIRVIKSKKKKANPDKDMSLAVDKGSIDLMRDLGTEAELKDEPRAQALAGVNEVSKYCTKPDNYLTWNFDSERYEVKDHVLEVLAKSIRGHRLIGYTGEFYQIRKEIKLEDVEEANLIKIGQEDDENPFKAAYEILCGWISSAARYTVNYKIIDDEEEKPRKAKTTPSLERIAKGIEEHHARLKTRSQKKAG
jgi:plasmid rolling circle replication initiator protein Rep